MVFCAKCGKQMKEGMKFCPRCGTPAEMRGGVSTISSEGTGTSGSSSW